MEINVLDWSDDHAYEKHDVVRVPYLYDQQKGDRLVVDTNSSADQYEQEVFSFEVGGEFGYTATVALRKIYEDTASKDNYKTHLQQVEESADTSLPVYDTGHRTIIDISESIGFGIGLKFFDENNKLIVPNDPRDFIRLLASSEIDHTNTIKAAIDIPARKIPSNAKTATLSIYGLGIKKGGIQYTRIRLRNFNTYFYCRENHTSSTANNPNVAGQEYWTQRFFWRPSYNSSVSYQAKTESLQMGDGNEYTTSDGLNALPIEATLRFENRTDKEAKAIAHFLQEKAFVYESMFSIDYKGNRNESAEIQSFQFDIGLPYKDGLHFTCTDFTHSIEYRNNHSLQARLLCNTVSVLDNIQGSAGYNDRQDAIFPIVINGLRLFGPERVTRLDTFQLEADENGGFPNDLARVGKHFEGVYLKENQSYLDKIGIFTDNYVTLEDDDIHVLTTDMQWWNFAINLKFNKPQTYQVGDIVYLHSNLHPDSIFSVGIITIAEVKSDTEFVTENIPFQSENLNLTDAVVENNGYEGEVPDFLFQKMERHPLDCMSAKLILPSGVDYIPHLIKNEITGEYQKREIISRDYRKFYLEKDILPTDYYIYLSSQKEYEVIGPFDFPVLVPEIRGKSSMYIKNSEFIVEYPWKSTRDFDYRPTMAFTVGNTPKHLETKFLKNFQKKYKKGINSNLVALNLTFEQRSDEEAAAILLFLESHLGYKRFSFDMPRPYLSGQNNNIVEEIKGIHAFYCPSWTHDIVYKNNHTISVTFIEAKTANLYEDNAGTLDACLIGGSIYDPFVSHTACTLSSSAVCYPQSGLSPPSDTENEVFYIRPKTKEVDIVFVIDTSAAISEQTLKVKGADYSKFDLVLDSIKKMTVGYDKNKFPGTLSFSKHFEVEPFKSDKSSRYDKSIPPWYVDEFTEDQIGEDGISRQVFVQRSLIELAYNPNPKSQEILTEKLEGFGYNTENLKRFNLRIEERAVNIGISLVGDKIMDIYPMDKDVSYNLYQEKTIKSKRLLDLPDYPNSFDKYYIYDALTKFKLQGGRGKNHLEALSDAVTQLFNAQRANIVDKRIIFYISDFYFNGSDEDEIIKIRDALKVQPRGEAGRAFFIGRIDITKPNLGDGITSGQSDVVSLEMINSSDADIVVVGDGVTNLKLLSQKYNFNIKYGDEGLVLRKDKRIIFSKVGPLARRRPLDLVLNQFGSPTLDEYIARYGYTESWREEGDTKYSNLFNPDFTGLFSAQNFILFLKRTILSENPTMDDSEAQQLAESQYNDIDPDDLLNPNWYSQPMNTLFFPIALGTTGEVSPEFDKFTNDYSGSKKTNELELSYKISNAEPYNEEAFRITNISKIVQGLTEDTGFQNLFSITLTNCGPNDIKVHNTIVGFDKENGLCTWTTDSLKYGIAKNDDVNNFEYHSRYKTPSNPEFGLGGQYYNDPNNEKLLYEDGSDLIWHSFNTEYEVYRNGKIEEINGGWSRNFSEFIIQTDDFENIILSEFEPTIQDRLEAKNLNLNPYIALKTEKVFDGPIKTKGIKNTGVAFKGMMVRVFKSNDDPIEIIDYNIGNVSGENNNQGDYSHLPILKRGESIDLFFGIRAPELEFFDKKLQLFFNTEDLKDTRMDCSAQFEMQIKIDKSRNVDKVLKGQSGICMLNGVQRDDLSNKVACEASGGEWIETLSDEDIAKNSAEIISLPTVPELTPSFDGLCDPYGVLPALAAEFRGGFGRPPYVIIAQELQYREWWDNYTNRANSASGTKDDKYLMLYKYYNPFGIDPTEFIELKNKYSCCYSGGWYPLDQYKNYPPGQVNAVGYYTGAALIGSKGRDFYWGVDGGILDYHQKWSMPPAIGPQHLSTNDLPVWMPEFLKQSSPWKVNYEYSDNGRYGPSANVNFMGLDYSLIKTTQQFFDVMMLESYFWHILANVSKGVLWKKGSTYYGQPVDQDNMNNFVQNTAYSLATGDIKRCKDEIFGKWCVDSYHVSWKYSAKHNYKNTLLNWFLDRGWTGSSNCPGGVRHEDSLYYKNKLAGIFMGRDDPRNDPRVFISAKSVGTVAESSQNFWVSTPYDQGQDPEEKLFGPWGITIPIKKDNSKDVIDEAICPRTRNVKLFTEYRVPFDHIQSIVANTPIRVRLRNSGYPEECRCSAVNVNSKTEGDQILFDGIGPFVLQSLDKYVRNQSSVGEIDLPEIGEEWQWSTGGYNDDPEFWDKYGIESGKQFFGAYGLYNATHIRIEYLGPEFVSFDRYNNNWVITRIPNDFCYTKDGKIIDCYEQYEQKNKNALDRQEKIITTLKPGSFHYDEIDWSNPKSVQYGYAWGNKNLINPRIYIDFRDIPDPGEDPSPEPEIIEGEEEEGEYIFESNELQGIQQLQECMSLNQVVIDNDRAIRAATTKNTAELEKIQSDPYFLLLKRGSELKDYWLSCLVTYTDDYGEEDVPWWVRQSPFSKTSENYMADALAFDIRSQINEVDADPNLAVESLYAFPTYKLVDSSTVKESFLYRLLYPGAVAGPASKKKPAGTDG